MATAEILLRSLANFYRQYVDRHMNLKFMQCISERERPIQPIFFFFVKNKSLSVSLGIDSEFRHNIVKVHVVLSDNKKKRNPNNSILQTGDLKFASGDLMIFIISTPVLRIVIKSFSESTFFRLLKYATNSLDSFPPNFISKPGHRR